MTQGRWIAMVFGLAALASCGIKGDPEAPGAQDRKPLVLEPGLQAQGPDDVNTTF